MDDPESGSNTDTRKRREKDIYKNVICWKCQCTILADKEWDKVRCSLCYEVNIVPDSDLKMLKPNVDFSINDKNFQQFTLVNCPFCKYKIRTKRESDYIICTKCKNTVIIIKDRIELPVDIDPKKYLKSKLYPFNPYVQNSRNPYYLEKDFEKKLVENVKGSLNDIKNSTQRLISKYEVYKPLSETIKEMTENIDNLNFTTPQPKRTIGDIVGRNFFSNNFN